MSVSIAVQNFESGHLYTTFFGPVEIILFGNC